MVRKWKWYLLTDCWDSSALLPAGFRRLLRNFGPPLQSSSATSRSALQLGVAGKGSENLHLLTTMCQQAHLSKSEDNDGLIVKVFTENKPLLNEFFLRLGDQARGAVLQNEHRLRGKGREPLCFCCSPGVPLHRALRRHDGFPVQLAKNCLQPLISHDRGRRHELGIVPTRCYHGPMALIIMRVMVKPGIVLISGIVSSTVIITIIIIIIPIITIVMTIPTPWPLLLIIIFHHDCTLPEPGSSTIISASHRNLHHHQHHHHRQRHEQHQQQRHHRCWP